MRNLNRLCVIGRLSKDLDVKKTKKIDTNKIRVIKKLYINFIFSP